MAPAYDSPVSVPLTPIRKGIRDHPTEWVPESSVATDSPRQLALREGRARIFCRGRSSADACIQSTDMRTVAEAGDLVYNKHSGDLIGFTDLGDINNHLLAFERPFELDLPAEGVLAKSMMTFMVRGLFSPLRFPYAHFPCANVTGDLLFSAILGGSVSSGEDGAQGMYELTNNFLPLP